MRIDEWEFADRGHVVYDRPPAATRWPVPLPGFAPAPYRTEQARGHEGDVIEPLQMDMGGHPSVDLYKAPGGDTIEKVALRTNYMPDIDTSEVEKIAEDMLNRMKDMSQGPYSLAMLAEMGHPYGFGEPGQRLPGGGYQPAEPPSWERLSRPRKLPSMAEARRGFRGRVPDQSIINVQSGNLLQRWSLRVLRWYGGLNLLFSNSAFYSWFLAHGTYKMQAHGPWGVVLERMLPQLHAAWRRAAYQAWRRVVQRQRAEIAAAEGQFGEGAVESLQEQAEAGGWS
jgi:hypothetical protein